jgi:hypothetical protein
MSYKSRNMITTGQSEYVVKYLGIVEGNVGCLSRKLAMPVKEVCPTLTSDSAAIKKSRTIT